MATGLRPGAVTRAVVVRQPISLGWLWSANGREIWYFDKPAGGPAGTWAVHLESGAQRLVSELWGEFSPSRRLIIRDGPALQSTVIYQRGTGTEWMLDRTGEGVLLSPDELEVAFGVRVPGSDPYWMRPADIYRARLNSAERTLLARAIGGAVGWRDDGHLLVVASESLNQPRTIRALDRDGTPRAEWPLGMRVRNLQLSPSRRFLAFVVVFDSPVANGQYVLDLRSGTRARIPGPSSVRWLPDESGLLIIPAQRRRGRGFELWRVSFPALRLEELLDDGVDLESFDWRVRPDGRAIAYRAPRSLHLRTLTWGPPAPPL